MAFNFEPILEKRLYTGHYLQSDEEILKKDYIMLMNNISYKRWILTIDEINDYKYTYNVSGGNFNLTGVEIEEFYEKYMFIKALHLDRICDIYKHTVRIFGTILKRLLLIDEISNQFNVPNEILQMVNDYKKYDLKGFIHQSEVSNFNNLIYDTEFKSIIKSIRECEFLDDFVITPITYTNGFLGKLYELNLVFNNGVNASMVIGISENRNTRYNVWYYKKYLMDSDDLTFGRAMNASKKHFIENQFIPALRITYTNCKPGEQYPIDLPKHIY